MKIYSDKVHVGQEIHKGIVARVVNGIVFTDEDVKTAMLFNKYRRGSDIDLIKWHNRGRRIKKLV